MNVLIAKLGATGDVVRTTPLLRRLEGQFTWLTAAKNTVLLDGLSDNVRCFSWENRDSIPDHRYDLVINLEDTVEVGEHLKKYQASQTFGAYVDAANQIKYTDDSRGWFDLSLISKYGRQQADALKLKNRRTYQDLIFSGLGLEFAGESYCLPEPAQTDLGGDVAIAPEAGPVWPMKNWDRYKEVKSRLEAAGLRVNFLPHRGSLLEHLGDVRNHRLLLCGDSLPMHFALGTGTRCVTLFTCTSPWEIYDYGLLTKIISPLLAQFFYQRGSDPRATAAIPLEQVLGAVTAQLESNSSTLNSQPSTLNPNPL
jgi:heptosyltransferase-2